MKYAMLIFPKPGSHESLPPEQYAPVNADYLALRDDPRCVGGAHLQPAETATTVRHNRGEVLITDGPFADTKEVLGGYYVLDAADLDDALEFAQRIPAIRLGGAVEIRPLVEIPAEAAF
ncbi:YciI family protein [Acidiferrimicrobium sp. IK]|uniref:YciI family protein n=1 Tax=Acidiferrimicrobium sp. IK TaxID=2871700 RepID=UPI0021CB45FC|nr:YciI family protein [Acidiferrimicrobium sp. IK]MCU4185376.1 YciI family protein [Acidiferrimicrobium sp. IK]